MISKTLQKECIICGNKFEVTAVIKGSGSAGALRKVYCSLKCKRLSKSPNKITKHCVFCGTKFLVYRSQQQKNYCKAACHYEHIKKTSNENTIIKQCKNCNKEYNLGVRTKNKGKKFCSFSCAGEFHRKRDKINCVICNVEFERQTRLLKKTSCCSRRCQYVAQSNGIIKLHSSGRYGQRVDLDDNFYKSSFEADYVRWCNYLNLKFLYEHKTFNVLVDGRNHIYTPDFYHPDLNIYVELKGGNNLFTENIKCVDALKSQGEKIDVIFMKDFYNHLKSAELYDAIPNIENRNYGKTKHLIKDSKD